MRPEWLWDRNIPMEDIKNILRNPQNERFAEMAALLLSRSNTPQEVFAEYLDQVLFVSNWTRIRRQMRKNTWNDPRVIFWQAVYEKLVAGLRDRGIAIRERKADIIPGELSRRVAQRIKSDRQSLGLTQSEFAQKICISQQIISRIEKGRNDTRLSTLEKIFRYLGEQLLIEPRSAWVADKISDGTKEVAHA